MQLVVLNIAYPFATVGPDADFPAEQELARLDAALAGSGHESIVMACEGSVTEGILLATPKPGNPADEAERRKMHEHYRFTLQKFLDKWPIDLIHMHGGDFYEYLPPPGIPVLVTLHLPVQWYPEAALRIERPQTFLHCVSASQGSERPACANLLPEIGAPAADEYLALYERIVSEARAVGTSAAEAGELSAGVA